MRAIRSTAAGLAATAALGAAGCGADDFANRDRAPTKLVVSAAITPREVTVSPSRIGAGAVELLASNLTSTSQRLTLRSIRVAGERTEQRTGPINPGDTASLTADLAAGEYRISGESERVDAAILRVGPPRPGADDELLLP